MTLQVIIFEALDRARDRALHFLSDIRSIGFLEPKFHAVPELHRRIQSTKSILPMLPGPRDL